MRAKTRHNTVRNALHRQTFALACSIIRSSPQSASREKRAEPTDWLTENDQKGSCSHQLQVFMMILVFCLWGHQQTHLQQRVCLLQCSEGKIDWGIWIDCVWTVYGLLALYSMCTGNKPRKTAWAIASWDESQLTHHDYVLFLLISQAKRKRRRGRVVLPKKRSFLKKSELGLLTN